MFQIFLYKIIFSLLNNPFKNNIAILESKLMYFCLRPNFSLLNLFAAIKYGLFGYDLLESNECLT